MRGYIIVQIAYIIMDALSFIQHGLYYMPHDNLVTYGSVIHNSRLRECSLFMMGGGVVKSGGGAQKVSLLSGGGVMEVLRVVRGGGL